MVLAIKKFDHHQCKYIENPNIVGETQVELVHNSLLEIIFPEGGISECKVDKFTDRYDLVNGHPEGHVAIVVSGLRVFYGTEEQRDRLRSILPDPKDLAAYGSLIVGDIKDLPDGTSPSTKKKWVLLVDHESGENGGFLPEDVAKSNSADSHGRVDHDEMIGMTGSTNDAVQHRIFLPNFTHENSVLPIIGKGTFISQDMASLPWQNLPEGVSMNDVVILPTSSLKGLTNRPGHDLLSKIESAEPSLDSSSIVDLVEIWLAKNLSSSDFASAKKDSPTALLSAQEDFRNKAIEAANSQDIKKLEKLINTEFPRQKIKLNPGLYEEDVWIGVKDVSKLGKMATASLLPMFPSMIKDIGISVENELLDIEARRSSKILLAQDFVKNSKQKTVASSDDETAINKVRIDPVVLIVETALDTQNYALLDMPSVVKALKSYDANQYRNVVNLKSNELAFDRGMLISSGELKAGEISIPGYADGEKVIGFRTPALNANCMFIATNRLVSESFDADGNLRTSVIITNRETAEEISYSSADKAIDRVCNAYGVDPATFIAEQGEAFEAFRKEVKEIIQVEALTEEEALEQSKALVVKIVEKITDPQLKVVTSSDLLELAVEQLKDVDTGRSDTAYLTQIGQEFLFSASEIAGSGLLAWEQGIETSVNTQLDLDLSSDLVTDSNRLNFIDDLIDKVLTAMDTSMDPEQRLALQSVLLETELSTVEIRKAVADSFELEPLKLTKWIGSVAINNKVQNIGSQLLLNAELPPIVAKATNEQLLGGIVDELSLLIGVENWSAVWSEQQAVDVKAALDSKISLQIGDGGWQTDLQRMGADHDGDCIGVALASKFPNLVLETEKKLAVGNRYTDVEKALKQYFPKAWTIEDVAVYNTTAQVGVISNMSTAFQSIESEIDNLLQYGTDTQIELFAKQVISNIKTKQEKPQREEGKLEPEDKSYKVPEKLADELNPVIEAILGEELSSAQILGVFKQMLRVLTGDIGYANQLGVDQPKSYVTELMGTALKDIEENRKLLPHKVSASERKDSTSYQNKPVTASNYTPQDLLVGKVNSRWSALDLNPLSMENMKHVFASIESTDREKDIAASFQTKYNSLKGIATQYQRKERDEAGVSLLIEIELNGNLETVEIANIEQYNNPQLFEALQLRTNMKRAIQELDIHIGGIGGDELKSLLIDSDRLDRAISVVNAKIKSIEGADGLTDHASLDEANELRNQLSEQMVGIADSFKQYEDIDSDLVGLSSGDQEELVGLLKQRQKLVSDLEQAPPLKLEIVSNRYQTRTGLEKQNSQTYHSAVVKLADEKNKMQTIGVVSEIDYERLGLLSEKNKLVVLPTSLQKVASVDISAAKFKELDKCVSEFKASLNDLNVTPEAIEAALWHNNLANFGSSARKTGDELKNLGILFNVFTEELITRLEEVNMATYNVAVPRGTDVGLGGIPTTGANVNFKILSSESVNKGTDYQNNLLAIEDESGEFIPAAFIKNESFPAQIGTIGVGKIEASMMSTADIKIPDVNGSLRVSYPNRYDLVNLSSEQISNPDNVYRINLNDRSKTVNFSVKGELVGELCSRSMEEYDRIKDLLPKAKSIEALTSGKSFGTRTRLSVELEDGSKAYLSIVNNLDFVNGEQKASKLFEKSEIIPSNSIKINDNPDKNGKAFLQVKIDSEWLNVGFISNQSGVDNPDGSRNQAGNKKVIADLQPSKVGIYPQKAGVGKEFSGELIAKYNQFTFVADKNTLSVDYSIMKGTDARGMASEQSIMYDKITALPKIIGQTQEPWRLDNGKSEVLSTLRIAMSPQDLSSEKDYLRSANIPFLVVSENDASVSKESQRGYRVIKVLEQDIPDSMRRELFITGGQSPDKSVDTYNITRSKEPAFSNLLINNDIPFEAIERDGKKVIRIDRADLKGKDESKLLDSLGMAVSKDVYNQTISNTPKNDIRLIDLDIVVSKSRDADYSSVNEFNSDSVIEKVNYPKGVIADFKSLISKDFGCKAQVCTYNEGKLLQFEFNSSKESERFENLFDFPIAFEKSGKFVVGVEFSEVSAVLNKSLTQPSATPLLPIDKISLEHSAIPLVLHLKTKLEEYNLGYDTNFCTLDLLTKDENIRDLITDSGGLKFIDSIESYTPNLVDNLRSAYLITDRPPILMMGKDRLFAIAVPNDKLAHYMDTFSKIDRNVEIKDSTELASIGYTQISIERVSDDTLAKFAAIGQIVETNEELQSSIDVIGSGADIVRKHQESIVGVEISATSSSELGRLLTMQTYLAAQNSPQREVSFDFRDNAARLGIENGLEYYGSTKEAGLPFVSAADAFSVCAKNRSSELGAAEFAVQFPKERLQLVTDVLTARFEQDVPLFNKVKASGGVDFLEKCSYDTIFPKGSSIKSHWLDGDGAECPMIQALCGAYENTLSQRKAVENQEQEEENAPNIDISIGVHKAKNQDPTYKYAINIDGNILIGEGSVKGKSSQAALEGLNAALAVLDDKSLLSKISVEVNSAEFVKGIDSITKPKLFGLENLELYQELSNRCKYDIEVFYNSDALKDVKVLVEKSIAIALADELIAIPAAIALADESVETRVDDLVVIPTDDESIAIPAAIATDDESIAIPAAIALVDESVETPVDDLVVIPTDDESIAIPAAIATDDESIAIPAAIATDDESIATIPVGESVITSTLELGEEQPSKIIDLSDRLFVYNQRKDDQKRVCPLPDLDNLAIIPIDRTSTLGNPFLLANENDDAQRELVVKACGDWLDEVLAGEDSIQAAEKIAYENDLTIVQAWKRPTNQQVEAALDKLSEIVAERPVVMSCWCAPKPCHGDVLKSAIEKRVSLNPDLSSDLLNKSAGNQKLDSSPDRDVVVKPVLSTISESTLNNDIRNDLVSTQNKDMMVSPQDTLTSIFDGGEWDDFKQVKQMKDFMNEQQSRLDVVAPIAAGFLYMSNLTEYKGKNLSMNYNPETAVLKIFDNSIKEPIAIAKIESVNGVASYKSMKLSEGNPGLSNLAVQEFIDLKSRVQKKYEEQKSFIEDRTLPEESAKKSSARL